MTSAIANGMQKALKPRNLVFGTLVICGTWFIADGLWIKTKAMVAQVLLDRAFVLADAGDTAKPWAWADMEPIARVEAPHLGQSNIVLNNVSGEALAFGPGHVSGTPMPGERGTTVFAAHRDTHFAWLGDLKKDDLVLVTRTDGTKIRYRMRRAWIAEAQNPGINSDSDDKLIALTTCWPLDGTMRSNWRYIVEGIAVEDEKDLSEAI